MSLSSASLRQRTQRNQLCAVMRQTLWPDSRVAAAGTSSPNQAIANTVWLGTGAASEGERFGPMPAAIQDRTEPLLKRQPRPTPYARVHHDVRRQYYDFKARKELDGPERQSTSRKS